MCKKYSLILIDKTVHINLATLLLKLPWLTRFYVAFSKTVYFLFKVGRARVIKYKPWGNLLTVSARGVVLGEEENIL